MTEVEQLKHRLAMVKDDLDIIRKFIYIEQLDKAFERQSETADECWTNLNNIEIACDLSTDEPLSWKLYSKAK
jgi:outer membrane PBP1 activator LpoA protein